jgi:hypothetical protein
MIDFDAATTFVWERARLLDRHRFAHLFLGGPRAPVLAALAAYANPDGGFGHALEPDLRAPASQPAAALAALEVLHEIGALDDPLATRLEDWLTSVSVPDGGVPFVLPLDGYPHAPWMRPDAHGASSLLLTPAIAAILLAHGRPHPWLERAVARCWSGVEDAPPASAYELRFALAFLEPVPDRRRAEAALASLHESVSAFVTLEPGADGEVHTPLDVAPRPDSAGRRFFSPDLVERHLDALEAAQQADGGWTFNWEAWSPGAAHEWRGAVTIHALEVLRWNGRLE